MQQQLCNASNSLHVRHNRLVARVRTARIRIPPVHSSAWQQPVHFKHACIVTAGWRPKNRFWELAAINQPSQLVPEQIPSDVKLELDSDAAAKEVTYDEASKTIRIPLAAINDGQRRTKMVMFTCNQCGGRSARLVNPVAWEKGAVFCQCQHCGVWHTLRAAKHIMEEVRYNDPEWQLDNAQPVVTAAMPTDGTQSEEEPESSSQTILELPSGDEQEAASVSSAPEQ